MVELKSFYYQIKGKSAPNQYSGFSDNWVFPPIFSGKVEAIDKKQAKELIEEEYNKKFPMRVLTKDLDSNDFLLKITPMANYQEDLFKDKTCKDCGSTFRRIDLYNDINTKYKGTEYCSDSCKERGYEKERIERQFKFDENIINQEGRIPCIYRIYNKKTKKSYIGQTIRSFTLRWWEHIKWGLSDCDFHKEIRESDLTEWTFEVIYICKSKEELDEKESFYIKEFDSIKNGYNTAKVGNHIPDKSQEELKEHYNKPEVNLCLPLDDKQEGGNGIPPTSKEVGILPTIL